ncbi:hypothetical protein V6B05_05445 [Lactococcus garvieae]|uniref:hypothetical protein n=1 Tax=Lactococcus garvieae TaxID=1363 RepID=UPI001F60B77C|nr:hypothetical protein [Lactococcus garvieae]MCI3860780.1 hypothetical protein [Lactococcus garvieae]
MGKTPYTVLMYRRILKRLLEIQDYYSFDIYNYQSEANPVSYSYLLILHRDNGTALRKALSKIFTSQDSRTIFIVADQYASKELSRIKNQGKITEELA